MNVDTAPHAWCEMRPVSVAFLLHRPPCLFQRPTQSLGGQAPILTKLKPSEGDKITPLVRRRLPLNEGRAPMKREVLHAHRHSHSCKVSSPWAHRRHASMGPLWHTVSPVSAFSLRFSLLRRGRLPSSAGMGPTRKHIWGNFEQGERALSKHHSYEEASHGESSSICPALSLNAIPLCVVSALHRIILLA